MTIRLYEKYTSGVSVLKTAALKVLPAITALALLPGYLQAQGSSSGSVSGKVIDAAGAPVPGAAVFIEGADIGAETDAKGYYQLMNTPSRGTIRVSSIGYRAATATLSGAATTYDFILEQDVIGLEDIIIVGYGQQRKESVVGAIVQLSARDIVQTPVANLSNALNGRLPGVVTMQRSGQPGQDDAQIYIRGQATMGGYDSAKPLILVDGVERGFNQIDANEIATLSVLKDASATAVYGVRGANGVILVTTRRGREGAPKVSLSYQYGIQNATRMPQTLTGMEYAELYQEAYFNDTRQANGIGQLFFTKAQFDMIRRSEDGTASEYEKMIYPNIDWIGEMVKKASSQQQANVNVSGGTKNIRYFISGGYLHQGSAFRDNELQKYVVGTKNYSSNFTMNRYNFRTNLDIDVIRNLVLRLNFGGRVENINSPAIEASKLLQWAYTSSPFKAAYYPGVGYPANGGTWNDFAMFVQGGFRNSTNSTIESTAILEYDLKELVRGLKTRANFSYDSRFDYRKSYNETPPLFDLDRNYDYPVYIRKVAAEPLMSAGSSYSNNNKLYFETGLDYARAFGDSEITGMILYNMQEYRINAQTPLIYMGLVSRVTYGYKLKYLAEINIGYNGSENFAKGKRFGFFPAFSAGWVISEEPFMKNSGTWINWLKIRGSYGEVGNDKIGSDRFLYYSDFNQFYPGSGGNSGKGDFGFGTNYYRPPGIREGRIGNPNVTWERARKMNVGFELQMFKGKLALVADLFYENRGGILISQSESTPQILGAVLPAVNKGKTSNRGFELELTHRNNAGELRYWAKGNFSFARNKVVFADVPSSVTPWQSIEERPIGQPLLYECIGFWTSEEDILNGPDHSGLAGYYGVGDRKYADYNKDGVVDNLDLHAGGNVYSSVPEITYGFNLGFTYRNFDFSVLLNGVSHVTVNFYDSAIDEFPGGGAVQKVHKGRWNPFLTAEQNANATYPALHLNRSLRAINSVGSYGEYGRVFKGDYLRLKNIEIGYTLPGKWTDKLKMSSVRIYANGNNLALLYDAVKIRDPESAGGDGLFYPQMRVINMGINVNF